MADMTVARANTGEPLPITAIVLGVLLLAAVLVTALGAPAGAAAGAAASTCAAHQTDTRVLPAALAGCR